MEPNRSAEDTASNELIRAQNEVPETESGSKLREQRDRALADMADLIARHRDIPELLQELAERLHRVIPFDVAIFSLHDPHKNLMQVHVWKGQDLVHMPAEVPVDSSPSGWVWHHQKMLVIPDMRLETRFDTIPSSRLGQRIECYCALPLTTPERRLGAIGMGCWRKHTYRADDFRMLSRVADLLALSLENTLTRSAFREEKARLEALIRLSAGLISNHSLADLLSAATACVRQILSPDFASIELYNADTHQLQIHVLDSSLADELADGEIGVPLAGAMRGLTVLHGEATVYDEGDMARHLSPNVTKLANAGIRSLCSLPLITNKVALGTLHLASKETKAFTRHDLDYLKHVAAQIALAMDNIDAYEEIAQLTEKLKTEKVYLEEEICSARNFEEIIGDSPLLRKILGQVNTVAPSDATVLILGETGTGKELIARAIHRMSSRKDASFIKLNCAAIPTGLLESELFGHEKGAFTGAVSAKIGRLELADKGTLFLDEVGDIPLELQPKLLRVLQDQEFERLGGVRTIRVNIRLIAATNRDLGKSVAAREFRSDLYYRLHVFPVHMPPLRERGKDIELLVRYFVQKFSRRMNKQIETIPTETMNALTHWEWPGNVRELENFIERSVILSENTILNVPLSELRPRLQGDRQDGTLESLEREHILRVLRETGGVISGLHGAAARLGMKRTTLQSRMQKMGITRAEYQN